MKQAAIDQKQKDADRQREELLDHPETVQHRREAPIREWTFTPRIEVEPGTDLHELMGRRESKDTDEFR